MLTEYDKKEIKKMIESAVKHAVEFKTKKRGDTPTDDLQLVPRKYVNVNGSVKGRPSGSVAQIGQHYFASDTNQFMTFTAQKTWVNGAGSIVANN